ncbi:hypothetical protein CLOM621_08607 [Clostridium sp. M62/1]|nr:hypothetical protein CLOM621_08607 [Clostridium sp. M62/1]
MWLHYNIEIWIRQVYDRGKLPGRQTGRSFFLSLKETGILPGGFWEKEKRAGKRQECRMN